MRSMSENIDQTIRHASLLLHQTRIATPVFRGAYWPLFFEETHETPPSEIDSCSTSLGIMSLTEVATKHQSEEDRQTIIEAMRTLIRMRNDNGSWPSVVSIKIEAPRMEGVINDTVMALNALLDGGFMTESVIAELKAEDMTMAALDDMENRLRFIETSVDWLCNNRVQHGWFYIGTEFIENVNVMNPAILPTANVILLLKRLLDYTKRIPACSYAHKIQCVYDEAMNWLIQVQHTTGGYGKMWSDKPRAPHTAMSILAMCTHLEENSMRSLSKAVRWILRWYTTGGLRRIHSDDVFDEYDQVFFEEKTKYRKRVIHHETYLEGVLLSAMVEAHGHMRELKLTTFHRIQFNRLIRTLANLIMNSQPQDGPFRGAFMSRRAVPAEKYPIYSIYYAVNSLRRLQQKGVAIDRGFLSRLIRRHVIMTFIIIILCVIYLLIPEREKGIDIVGIVVLGVFINALSLLLPARGDN